jgi:protein-S-isoprenylcysteine O-methyltransferase Ste14
LAVYLAGTTLPMLLVPVKTSELWVGYWLQILGITISIFGLISLKRSFGLVAANRGIVSSGLYQLVRHPLYSSYELSIIGFDCKQSQYLQCVRILCPLACQIQRINYEESLLSKIQNT